MEEDEESQEDESDEESEEEESSNDKTANQDQEMAGDSNVRVITLKLFKYWPSKDLRNAWREYVFQEVVDNNLLALSVAIRILNHVNAEFLQRQLDNQQKKLKREANIAAASSTGMTSGKAKA